MDILEEEHLVERAAHLETVLTVAVEPLRGHELVTDIRSGAAFAAGVKLRDEVPAGVIADACIEAGVVIRAINMNTLQICPPFVTTEDEIAQIVQTIAQALDNYRA